jgi:hypothetical protein
VQHVNNITTHLGRPTGAPQCHWERRVDRESKGQEGVAGNGSLLIPVAQLRDPGQFRLLQFVTLHSRAPWLPHHLGTAEAMEVNQSSEFSPSHQLRGAEASRRLGEVGRGVHISRFTTALSQSDSDLMLKENPLLLTSHCAPRFHLTEGIAASFNIKKQSENTYSFRITSLRFSPGRNSSFNQAPHRHEKFSVASGNGDRGDLSFSCSSASSI